MALSVALADTFLLRSMVLCAVPTFLAPAFPTRDSLPESRCKITTFLRILFHSVQKILRMHFCVPNINDIDGLLLFVKAVDEFDSFLDMNISVRQFFIFQQWFKCA